MKIKNYLHITKSLVEKPIVPSARRFNMPVYNTKGYKKNECDTLSHSNFVIILFITKYKLIWFGLGLACNDHRQCVENNTVCTLPSISINQYLP